MNRAVSPVFAVLILILLCAGFLSPSLSFQWSTCKALADQSPASGFDAGLRSGLTDSLKPIASSNPLEDLGLASLIGESNVSTRLIVRLNGTNTNLEGLAKVISVEGGKIANSISIEGNVMALAVEVPKIRAVGFCQTIQRNKLVASLEPDPKAEAFFVPNDPYWSVQWGPQKIEAEAAWNTSVGSSDILVAVLDTGIDYNHPDLAANYVPLGYDWVNNDNDPLDDFGHGTHCAGIIAATINNSIGIAGLAQVKIMAEKVMNAGGMGYYDWIAAGVYDAVAKGAKIISMSLGGSDDAPIFHDAVKYALAHGVLVIAAAGNSHSNVPMYPAAYPEVIAVSATDENDTLASFSNFGNWIDLAAPGVNIYSTMPTYTVMMNIIGYDMNYTYASGTSMACPHVAGVAALTWSLLPSSTPDRIRTILEHTADDLGAPGFDTSYGYGRINARRAVEGIPEHDVSITSWSQRYRLDPGQFGIFNVTVSNYGRNSETNLSVEFFVNAALTDTAIIGFLGTGSSAGLSFSWGTETEGVYNVTCYVVPVLGENFTENNVAQSNVAVRPPTVLRVPSEYPTVKAAIGGAGEDDTILVSEGCYAEGEIDVLKNNLTLLADGRVTLDGMQQANVLTVMANYATINGFDIRNASAFGVNVAGIGNVITGNTIVEDGQGIHLSNSENCVISHNLVATSGDLIDVEYSANNVISQNRLVGSVSRVGISLLYASNNTVTDNTVSGGIGEGAILLCLSEDNFIGSNNVTGNQVGLGLVGSVNNTLRANIMVDNWCNFASFDAVTGGAPENAPYVWYGSNDVDSSNTVDGKPIYYWINVADRAVPSDAGCVVLVNCKNITAENLDLRNNSDGIVLINSSNVLIRNNNITHNIVPFSGSAITVGSDSYNVTITQNNLLTNWNGISLFGPYNTASQNNIVNSIHIGVIMTDNETVTENNVTSTLSFGGAGIFMTGSNCILSSNIITSSCQTAIFAAFGSNNTIVSNSMVGYATTWLSSSNEGAGIWLTEESNCTISSNNFVELPNISGLGGAINAWDSSNNVIFHNNFVRTRAITYESSTDTWDSGYPSGGNYWNDYTGTDQHSGTYQNETGSDGIGDTPYVIDANNLDRYPLMTLWPENSNPTQAFTLRIVTYLDSSYDRSIYDTTFPVSGLYYFMANSTAYIDAWLCHNTFVDHWELDGVNMGSKGPMSVWMNKNHFLTVYLKSAPPITVSIIPEIAYTDVDEPVTFTSTVSGGKTPFQYQWFLNGIEVYDGTDATWTFTPKTSGTYQVSVSVSYPFANPETSSTSTVHAGLYASISPTSLSTYVGNPVTFASTTHSGMLPYSYQWFLDGAPVSGATSPSWIFAPTAASNYTVHLNVTDAVGTTFKSSEASVTVANPVVLSILPVVSQIDLGQSVAFSSSVSGGYPPYSYQWCLNSAPVSGATSPSWAFTPTAPGNYTVCLNVTDAAQTTFKSTEVSVTVHLHDIAVATVATDQDWIYAGRKAYINATIINLGDYPENANITLYYNISANQLIGTSTVSLNAGENKTITFAWNTQGVTVCRYYSVTATAEIQSDANPANNQLTGATLIKVRIAFDINNDDKVDMRDIGTAALAFGARVGETRWNPTADVTGPELKPDGIVNMRDIAAIARTFGSNGT